MYLQPILATPEPCSSTMLPFPEAHWHPGLDNHGWMSGHAAPLGEWDEMFLDGEVCLSPELDAAYDRAIDAAWEKVIACFCGPAAGC